MTWYSVLSALATAQLAVVVSIYAYGLLASLRRRLFPAEGPGLTEDLGVSVLKPLHGIDPSLERNLESFGRLDASKLEVLLLVDRADDPARAVALRVSDRYPGRFRVVVGTDSSFTNPKVGSLYHALPHARHALLWVTDSNVETSNSHLRAQLAAWSSAQREGRRPTLVHAPLAAVGGSGLGASFERLQLVSYNNVNHEVTLLAGIDSVVGKSLLFHREDLAAVGGLESFGSASGEDFLMGRAFRQAGVVRCSSSATRQVLGESVTARQFFDRQRRWGRVRRGMAPASFFGLEHFTYFAVPLALAAIGLLPPLWVGLAFALKAVGDASLYAAYTGERPRPMDVLVLPLKEIVLLGAWLAACFGREITWRQRTLRVEAGGAYTFAPASLASQDAKVISDPQ